MKKDIKIGVNVNNKKKKLEGKEMESSNRRFITKASNFASILNKELKF